jgi:hypothetical protein
MFNQVAGRVGTSLTNRTIISFSTTLLNVVICWYKTAVSSNKGNVTNFVMSLKTCALFATLCVRPA